MPEVDAALSEQVSRNFRLGIRFEIGGCAHDRGAMILGYSDRNHVLLDEFAVVNTCIEASRDNIETAVVGGDVEQDVRVVARKLPELRGKHRRGGKSRQQQAQAARRLVAQSGELAYSFLDIGEGRAQTHKELLAGFR